MWCEPAFAFSILFFIRIFRESNEISDSAKLSRDCTLGGNIRIGEKTVVKKSIIGEHCTIGADVKINHCIIMDHVKIADGCTISGGVLGSNAQVQERYENRCTRTTSSTAARWLWFEVFSLPPDPFFPSFSNSVHASDAFSRLPVHKERLEGMSVSSDCVGDQWSGFERGSNPRRSRRRLLSCTQRKAAVRRGRLLYADKKWLAVAGQNRA